MEEHQLIFDTEQSPPGVVTCRASSVVAVLGRGPYLVPPHQEFEIRLNDRCLYRGRGMVEDAAQIAASNGGGHPLLGGSP